MNFKRRLQNTSGRKLFLIGGLFLIVIGEALDLVLSRTIDLWFQLVILILMAALLIYTMNKK